MVRNERFRSRDAHVRRSREFMLLKMVMIAVYGDDRELQCVEQLLNQGVVSYDGYSIRNEC